MRPQTWADVDRIAAARQAKRRECVERLSRILAKEFDLDELKFIVTFDYDAIRIEAYEIATYQGEEVNELGSKRPVDMQSSEGRDSRTALFRTT